MAFNATWMPGPEAVAGMHTTGLHTDQTALVMHLDKDSLAIMAPAEEMAAFFDVRATVVAERGE
jgi:hypothetical protein